MIYKLSFPQKRESRLKTLDSGSSPEWQHCKVIAETAH